MELLISLWEFLGGKLSVFREIDSIEVISPNIENKAAHVVCFPDHIQWLLVMSS